MIKKAKASAIFIVLFLMLSLVLLLKYLIFPLNIERKSVLFVFQITILFLFTFVYALFNFVIRKKLFQHLNRLAVVLTSIFITYTLNMFLYQVNIYAMPIFLTAFLLSPLSKRKDAFFANIFCVAITILTILSENIASNSLNYKPIIMFLSGIFGGTFTVFSLSYERKRLDFILKGVLVCLTSLILVSALHLISISLHNLQILDELLDTLFVSSISIFSCLMLSLLCQPINEKIFNLLTNSRLIELTDHNSPLIKRLILEAPGTFNHSLAVANFAEVCATSIGENPYMARAVAYYHDIGKLNNPLFFKENQGEGDNPHDTILPEISAQIIKKHTVDGFTLCKKYKIPREISEVTIEHHGTLPISMFYYKAKDLTDSEVNIKEYSYDGNTPSSKIAAIIMICDSAEAAIRAMNLTDAVKTDELVTDLIWQRIRSGQFTNCNITLKELNTIKDTIVNAFGGVFHKRIEYRKE